MTVNPEPEVLEDILRKGKEKLEVAEIDSEHGYYGEVASRAYYAVFHAVSAVLAFHGMSFSSHSQTIGAFNRDFVKTGIFPRNTGRCLNRMFEDRQVGDYDWSSTVDRETAELDLNDARRIWSECRKYLEEQSGQTLTLE